MLASSIPTKIQLPFASAGTKNTIPVPSQIGITPGAASYTDGFPPLTFTALTAGGIPPDGADVNGVLNAITAIQQWQSAGGHFKYDSAFSTAIGGYPAGAILNSSDGLSQWLNLADNNTTDPDGATPANWAALSAYGITTISGLTNANVTLTATQYKNRIIVLTGTLTGNIQIIFPTLLSDWKVINNTTGAFTVTCKTAAGTGGTVPQSGGIQEFYGDATNLIPIGWDGRYQNTVQGLFKNLQASSTGLNANVTVTADEIIVEDGSNLYKTLRNVNLTAAITGTGANGLDTGTLAASTWYSRWIIWNGTTAALLWSLSATAPTMPAGYTHKARCGWDRTDGTANKFPLSFKQYGRKVRYVVAAGSNVTGLPIIATGIQGSPSTPTWVAAATAAFVPQTASVISLLVRCNGNTSTAAPNNSYGAYTSTTNPPPIVMSAAGMQQNSISDILLESSNIYIAGDNTGSLFACAGWEDTF